ncbi:MAG: sugar phosphate isomerase/epimerase [Myxococcales bacterium]|nr:sugar phosphate isomerase/epimerase [Myxococcales bacterium]
MRLAYSTNGFTRRPLPDAIRAIGALGYAGVEILADAPHWVPGRSTDADTRAVEAALTDAGLAVSNINANTAGALWPIEPPEPVFEPSLSNRDPAVRRRRLEYSFACVDLAARLGAPAVSVTSGRPEAAVLPADGMGYFADSLAELCAFAAARGVRVGVEAEPGLLVENSVELRALIDRVDHPALGANLDVGHAICAFEAPDAVIERLAGRIWNVHLEDIAGRKHHHLVPGEGDVDFEAVFRSLAAAGYAGFCTVELYTCADRDADAAGRAHQHLAPRLAVVVQERSRDASGGRAR